MTADAIRKEGNRLVNLMKKANSMNEAIGIAAAIQAKFLPEIAAQLANLNERNQRNG